jgi:uncharacterized membrane protein
MNSYLRYHWEAVRTSYWFLPAVLGIVAIVAAPATIALDRSIQDHPTWIASWTYGGGPEGARAVLATIAGSMITVAGVVFSITIVALSLATGQFGPLLLRNFIRDRRNQFVLGTFTATFLYCLLVLRTVRGMDHEEFVPGVSVTVGILLAIANLGVLIYFIHHVAMSIQASHVIQSVTEELRQTIDRLWPEDLGQEPPPTRQPESASFPPEQAEPLVSTASGYVDAINEETLMALARDNDLVIRLVFRPGQFAVAGVALAWVWPRERASQDTLQRLNRAFVLVPQRSPFQDVEFAVDQLVEIAVRALSPGINDPFTAMICIHRLGEALSYLAGRSIPSAHRYDQDKSLRIITYPADFRAVADAAFNQIRQYGAGSVAVLICLLETLRVIARFARRPADRAAVAHHAELIYRTARRCLQEEADLADVTERYDAVQQELSRQFNGKIHSQLEPSQ